MSQKQAAGGLGPSFPQYTVGSREGGRKDLIPKMEMRDPSFPQPHKLGTTYKSIFQMGKLRHRVTFR